MPLVYRTGATRLVVYPSEFAGTNRANAAVWGVGDELDSIVAALEAKGVEFEHYPDIGRLEGNVHVAEGARLWSWLKDPDGNILTSIDVAAAQRGLLQLPLPSLSRPAARSPRRRCARRCCRWGRSHGRRRSRG